MDYTQSEELLNNEEVIRLFTKQLYEEALSSGDCDDKLFNAYFSGYCFIKEYYKGDDLEERFKESWERAKLELKEDVGDEDLEAQVDAIEMPDMSYPSYSTYYEGDLLENAVLGLFTLLPQHMWRFFPSRVISGFITG